MSQLFAKDDDYSSEEEHTIKYTCEHCDSVFTTESQYKMHHKNSTKCECIRNTLFICKKCFSSMNTLHSLYDHYKNCDSDSSSENIFDRISDVLLEKNEKIDDLTFSVQKQKSIIDKLKVRLRVATEKVKLLRSLLEKPKRDISQTCDKEQTSPRLETQTVIIEKNVKTEEVCSEIEEIEELVESETETEEEKTAILNEPTNNPLYKEMDSVNTSEVQMDFSDDITHILENESIVSESESQTSDISEEDVLCLNNEPVLTNQYIEQKCDIFENEANDIKTSIEYADTIVWVAACEKLRDNVRHEISYDFSVLVDELKKEQKENRENLATKLTQQISDSFDTNHLRLSFSQAIDIYDNEVSLLEENPKIVFTKVCKIAQKLRTARLLIFLTKGTKDYFSNTEQDILLYVKKIDSLECCSRNENYVLVARNINSFLSNFDQYMIVTNIQRNRSTDIQQANFNRCDCFVKLKPNERRNLFEENIPFSKPDNTLCAKMRKLLWLEFKANIPVCDKFKIFRRNDFIGMFRGSIIGIKYIHDILDYYFKSTRFYSSVVYVPIPNQTHSNAFFVLEKITTNGKRYWRHDFMLDDICSSVTSDINAIIVDILIEFMNVFNNRTNKGTYHNADLRLLYKTILTNVFYTIDMKLFGAILRKYVIKHCEYVFTENDFIINLNLLQTRSTFSFRPSITNLTDEFRTLLMRIFMEECVTYREVSFFNTKQDKENSEKKWMEIRQIALDNIDKFLSCFSNAAQYVKEHGSITPEHFTKLMNLIGGDSKRKIDNHDTQSISENVKDKISNRMANDYLSKLRHMELSICQSSNNIDTIINNIRKNGERNFLKQTLSWYSEYLQKCR